MAQFFVIFDRKEEGSSMARGNESEPRLTFGAAAFLKPAKPQGTETAARWSGNVESARIANVDAATASEARAAVAAWFGSSSKIVHVAEGNFLEPTTIP